MDAIFGQNKIGYTFHFRFPGGDRRRPQRVTSAGSGSRRYTRRPPLLRLLPWFCSFRLWRYINHLLTYLLTAMRVQKFSADW